MKHKVIKDLNQFAFPLLIQFIASYLMGVSDIAIVARLSTEAFNAVTLVSSTLSMMAGVLGAITIVLNIKLGKKLGENDKNGFQFEFFTSVMLSLMMGIAFFLLMLLGNSTILRVLYGLQGGSLTQAVLYANPMSVYMLLQLLLFAFGTLFKVQNKTQWILIGSTTASVLNLILDYIFVLGNLGAPKLGVSMAGWSSVLSLTANLIIYLLVAKVPWKGLGFTIKQYASNMFVHIKESIILILQEIIDGSIFTIGVNMIVIRVGELEYAALSIINALLGFLFIFKHIYGSATISLTSINNGKNDKKELLTYPKYASVISSLAYCLGVVLLLSQKRFFSGLISSNDDAIEIVLYYLIYFLVANIFSSGTYIYQCALQATGQTKYVLYSTIVVNLCTLTTMIVLSMGFNLSLFGIAVAYFVNETLSRVLYKRKFMKNFAGNYSKIQ